MCYGEGARVVLGLGEATQVNDRPRHNVRVCVHLHQGDTGGNFLQVQTHTLISWRWNDTERTGIVRRRTARVTKAARLCC